MAKVVIADLQKRTSKRGQSSVRSKRVRNAQGKMMRVWSLDANSPSFIDDLTEVFRRNVRKHEQKTSGCSDRRMGRPGIGPNRNPRFAGASP